ncbi:MAG: Spy/CpxP family protein refolding chaperone [Moraxellaceae bacterium]|nr:Spy/CpxP family protein refolding chaperone [Moraxellaceae bacterium]
MKNKLIATVLATGMAMTTGTAFAGGQHGHKNAHFGKHGGVGMHMKMYKNLGLSKQQQVKIKSIVEQAKPNKAEMRANQKAHHQAKQQLVQSVNLNRQELNQLAEQTASKAKQRFVKRVKTQHQIWQTLTAEQRQKLIKRQDKRMQKFEKRMQKRGFGKHDGGMHTRMYKKLGLSTQQQAQIKNILEQAKPNKAEIQADRKAHMQATRQLVQSTNLNEYQLNKLAEQTASKAKQRFIKRIRTQNQIWQILTPEQRQKVIKRQAKKHARR